MHFYRKVSGGGEKIAIIFPIIKIKYIFTFYKVVKDL